MYTREVSILSVLAYRYLVVSRCLVYIGDMEKLAPIYPTNIKIDIEPAFYINGSIYKLESICNKFEIFFKEILLRVHHFKAKCT